MVEPEGGEGDGETEAEGLTDGDTEELGLTDGLTLDDGETDGLAEELGLTEALGLREALGLTEGETDDEPGVYNTSISTRYTRPSSSCLSLYSFVSRA